MNLADNHSTEKAVSAIQLFKREGSTTAIQLLQNQQLKEHLSKVPAVLICVFGEVTYEDENAKKEVLSSGNYVLIEPNIKHWLNAKSQSQLILLK